MGRWPGGGQERLQQAAIELFAERGYERTTVAEIAVRAGLTERTFYNHFADKREVLFPGQDRYAADLGAAVAAAPTDTPPLDAVVTALLATTDWFDQRRDAAGQRRAILDARPELRERELAKFADLTATVAAALRSRGEPATAADLTAAAATTAFQLASAAWLADRRGRTLGHHLKATVSDLRRTATTW